MTTTSDTIASAKKIAQSIAALPPLPVTAEEILTCFGDEFIDADKVTGVVEGDPGISAKLLGLTNSAYFGLSEPVNSIHDAILRVLGVDTVRSLVLAMAIQKSFSSKDCPAFDTQRFWMSSLQTAECCKKIVGATESATNDIRDLAYSTGLCHNLGLMVLAHIAPAATNSILGKHNTGAETGFLAKAFLEKFQTNHKTVTAALAQSWSLPEAMVSAYQYRAFPDQGENGTLGRVLAAAAAAVGNTGVDEDLQLDLCNYADAVGLTEEALQGMALLGERQLSKVQSLAGNMSS